MKIAITGHRPNKLGNDYDLTSPLLLDIRKRVSRIVLNEGATMLITGMALGIDTMFAEIAVELKIPFIAAIPFKGQESMWPPASIKRYRNLLEKAAEIVNVSGDDGYLISYMQMRNIWMVNNCDILIAVWDGTHGGTGNCVAYAERKKEIIRIDPSVLRNRYL